MRQTDLGFPKALEMCISETVEFLANSTHNKFSGGVLVAVFRTYLPRHRMMHILIFLLERI